MHAPFRRLTVSILALAITSVSVFTTSRADLVVSPPSLSAELFTGQSADRLLTLTNSGDSPISYALRIEAADAVAVRNLRRSRLRGLMSMPRGTPRGIAKSPEQPRALKPWHTVQPALRPRLAPAAGSGAVLATDLRVLILNSGAGVIEIQAVLAALPDIGQVDVFDGQVAAPSVAELAAYDVVLLVTNSPLADPVATGDALADYVDAGGSVMLTLASFVPGWNVAGRFMDGGYHPLSAVGGPIGSAALGPFDPQHPIMLGVSAATGSLLADATLAPSAELVASWDNGEPFVAARERSVIALNLFVADAGFWTGDIPILLRNAMLWSANDVSWLSASPDSGVVLPGGQATASVRFDAAGLAGGAYDAVVVVDPTDSAVPEVPVPAHLDVTGAPDLLLEGMLSLSESAIDFLFDGATTLHALSSPIAPGGNGTLEVIGDGDFGQSFETATVVLEGHLLGSVGASGNDCTAATSRFVLSASDLAGWVADQVVQVTVQNTLDVNAFCAVNRHTVRLSYRGPADSLDFASGIVGVCESLSVALSNRGSEPLTVEITSDRPEFSAPAFHEVQPGESREVQIFFCPTAIGVVTGTMTLATNDPDQPQLTIELRGEGVVPPDIEVSPDALSADLLTGATAVRTLTIRNTGGEELAFEIDFESVAETTATRAPAPPPRGKSLATSADRAPKGWTALPAPRLEGSAQVLLIQDTAPWSSNSNEQVLQANGIPYVSIPTSSIATTNLSAYSLVIVAGDQFTSTYGIIAGRQQQLAAYVAGGGILDFHAAGWGWANGDASLVTFPGGMNIEQYYAWNFNDVLLNDHPILAGVPDPFTGTPTSHGIFTNIPPGADLLANDEQGRPTLVVYKHGRGTVIASAQPLEYGYAAGQNTGLILANLIPYAFGLAPGWLDAQPPAGSVPPGGSTDVLVTFDATGLNGGDYEGRLIVASNDPDEGEILVPADLHVTGAPDLRIEPRPIVLTSSVDFTTSGATTMHHLPTLSAPEGDGQIELGISGDFPDSAEFAVLVVEGTQLFSIGPVPTPCGTAVGGIGVGSATLAAWLADGVVDAEVHNSSGVDPICPVNRHTVQLTYLGAVTAIDFGTRFVGACHGETLRVANAGTDVLDVQIASSLSAFTVQPSVFSLAPGAETPVVVTFCPPTVDVFDGTLTLQSNDPDELEVVIALHGQGVPPPDIEVSPPSLSADLFTGQVEVRTLTVRNTGGSDLVFAAGVENPSILPQAEVRLAKGETDTRRGPPILHGRGGPDAFGYRWVDSDEPGGPTFDWVEIAGVGTAVPYFGDDWNSGPVPIGFEFPYYDGRYGTVNICSNGWISFTNTSAQYVTYPLPSPFAPENQLAALWGDLYTDPGEVLYHNDGTRLIVEYRDVTFLGGSIPFTFQVLLYPSGRIVYQYLDLGGTQPFATVGFQNATQSDGLTIAFQAPYLHPGLAIEIASRPSWLSVTPANGVIPAGGSIDLEARFDASGLFGGTYDGTITIASNDPDEPQTTVPAQLHVTGAPDLQLGSVAIEVESSADFTGSGAVTQQTLLTPTAPEDGGQVTFGIEGDISESTDVAVLTFDGVLVAALGGSFPPCAPFTGFSGIGQTDLLAFTADGVIHAEVRNSPSLDATCPVNRHTIKLRYRGPATALDFGSTFVGGCQAESLRVANVGTDVLNVNFVTSAPEFTVAPPALSLPPGAEVAVMVSFCPPAVASFDGTLTLQSNDPDEPKVVLALHGVGVPPPDVEVSPTALSADLLTGQTATRTVTIRNTGGSTLDFTVDPERIIGEVAAWAPLPAELVALRLTASRSSASRTGDPALLRTDRAPEGYRATAPLRMDVSTPVLLIQDVSPWGTFANENALQANGIAYVSLPTSAIASTDLSAYRLVIVASDQYTSSYVTLAGLQGQLSAYVEQGGVLEFHAAGWGWQGGDASVVTVPGGMSINQYFSGLNHLLDPSHPILLGVPNPFGSPSSHAYFGEVPTGARLLAADDFGRPTLVTYRLGEGEVIATTQTVEFLYAYGYAGGQILANMIPFSFRKGPPWLSAFPRSGSLPPGGALDVTVGIDAGGLVGGDYQAVVVVRSNDPDESETPVSVALHVTGAPDLALPGPHVNQVSAIDFFTSGATTLHDLPVPGPSEGPGVAVLLVDGDFDSAGVATLTVEGTQLGGVNGFFPCGQFAGAFFVSSANLAAWTADGVVHAEVQNSAAVDLFCLVNRHTVQIVYQSRLTRLEFGSIFAGQCRPDSMNVANNGTDDLHVAFASSRPEFVAPPPLVLPPGGGVPLAVSFCPTTPGIFDGTLTLTTNDPDEPVVTIALHGEAVAAPDIAVGATRVIADLLPGETGSKTLRIANHGESPLTAHLDLRVAGSPVAARPAVVTLARPERPSPEHLALRSRYGTPSARATAPMTLQRPAAATWAATPAPPRTQAYSVFFDDMEHGIGGWTHRSTTGDSVVGLDLWAQSHNRSSSGVTSWRVMQHDFQGADALESPPIDLNGLTEATLTFMHWYQFDDCTGTPDFEPDGGIVEVSTDGGASWMQIQPRNGYPFVLDDICGNPLAFRPAYAHQNGLGAFQPDTFDLSGFTGQTIRLRFHAGWDCGNCIFTNEGWYIDDVSVFAPTAPWVSVSPHDLIVGPLDEGEATLTFDATLVPPGVYDAWLDISSNDPDEPFVSIPVNLVVADVGATVQVLPETINLHPLLKSLTANLESPPGHGPADVVHNSVRFNRDAAPDPVFSQIVDADHNGIPELRLKFLRSTAVPTLAEGDPTPVVITGIYTDGLRFLARDELRVVRPRFASPDPGQRVVPGTPFVIEWTVPEGWSPTGTDVFWSRDDGVTWQPIAMGVAGARATWTPPEIEAPSARVRIAVHDPDGLIAITTSGAFRIERTATAIEQPVALGGRQLLQNAPNPFRAGGATSIAFRLPEGTRANLRVYDLTGHLVRVLVDGWLPAGDHLARWDGRDRGGRAVGSGIYFYRLDAGGWRESRRMTLLR